MSDHANSEQRYQQMLRDCGKRVRELYKEGNYASVARALAAAGHPEVTPHYVRRILRDQGVQLRSGIMFRERSRTLGPVTAFTVNMTAEEARVFDRWRKRFPTRSAQYCAIEAVKYAVREAARRGAGDKKGLHDSLADVLSKEFEGQTGDGSVE